MKQLSLFLSLAAFCLAQVRPRPNPPYFFAQLADGGGWQSTITLVNPTQTSVSGRLQFFDSVGRPLLMPVSRTGGRPGDVAFVVLSAPGKSIFVVQTSGDAAQLKQGYASFTFDEAPGPGVALLLNFRQRVPGRADFEAVTSALPGTKLSFGMPFDNSAGFSTAVALVNTDSIVGDYVFAFYDESGLRFATSFVGLNSLEHAAFSLPDLFPLTAGRRGYFEVLQSPLSGAVISDLVLLVLRFNPSGPFTSIPTSQIP